MSREWCTRCQSIQNMNTMEVEKLEKDENGKEQKVITKSSQCSVCCSFIKSEETREYATAGQDSQGME